MTFSAPFCLVEPLKLVSASTAFITQFMLNHHSVIIHHPKFCSSHPYYLLSLVYFKYWPDGYVISTWFIHHLHQFHCSWCPWLLFMYWWLMMVIVVWTRSAETRFEIYCDYMYPVCGPQNILKYAFRRWEPGWRRNGWEWDIHLDIHIHVIYINSWLAYTDQWPLPNCTVTLT